MSTVSMTPLSGQGTLVASWKALARSSLDARVVRTKTAVAAIFPAWAPLNNAILLDEPSSLTAAAATAAELNQLYGSAGVDSWAMWLPASATSLGASDHVAVVGGMRRDTTTLVMQLAPVNPWPEPEGIVRTSIAAAGQAGDEPVLGVDLPEPDHGVGLDAWVMVRDGLAVAGAWSVIEGTDCGIYAVGTVPVWRRRGLATGLMHGILGDAYRRGARTATLQSTPMGQPLYRSLGFEPVGRYEEWVPA
ncbi:MAG: GNAT family N-acetyltransferase [Dermatophilaceae bacterium]